MKPKRTTALLFRLGNWQYEDVETGLYYNRFRYYNPETGLYISKDPISILGGLNVYAYVHGVNSYVDPLGLNLIDGMPLPDETKLFRIGGSSLENLKLKPIEMDLDPLGISLIRAKSMQDAGEIMKNAYPNAKKMIKDINVGNISEISAESIRKLGFDVIHNPTKGIGDSHARLIHPDGVAGFNENNLSELSKKFKYPS